MAETAVGLVIDKLIPLLTEEAHLLKGIHDEVEDIKCEIEFLHAFLKDADTRAERDQIINGSSSVKVWVQKLREKAFEVEDVIDEYTHLMAQERRPQKNRFISFLHRSACLIIKLKPRHDIASKIQEIKRTIRNMNQKRAEYGFNFSVDGSTVSAPNNQWYDPRKDSCFLKETEVVGIESTRAELIAKVEDDSSTERSVISLVGMGGLGKTTLAHQVYVGVRERFDCHAWIEVSKTYNNVELLRNLMKKFHQARKESVPEGVDGMNESTMTRRLNDYLQGKSYFVVFDDVWKSTFWADVKNALPGDNGKRGRIMITTRFVDVANFCKQSARVDIRQLQCLPPNIAWELFCKRAFHSDFDGQCPTNLKDLSHEILDRCDGLPLAIVAIAGVLSTKNKTADEWRKLLTSLSSELESNEELESIEKILALSYSDLPYYLKPCFLYLGIFPEDYSIRKRRLIRQWIAEGFVKPRKNKTLEEIAEEYLAVLINRSLVQLSEDFDGKPKSCRIHDLLREIAVKKMEALQFCQVLPRRGSELVKKCRRVFLHSSYDALESYSETSHVRSLFMLLKEEMPNSFVRTIPAKFKLLKVLDFEDAPSLDHLPEDIGILFHLRYLSIRRTRVQFLPKSIGKLENLETLDLKHSLVNELPPQINRLHKLRHLLAYHRDDKDESIKYMSGVKVGNGIGMLKALQKMFFIEANSVGVDALKELSELIEVTKLGITKLRYEDGENLCRCIQNMEHLESLSLYSISENETLDLESISFPPKFLQRLYLRGHLKKFPKWIAELQNLVRIRITWSKLEDDPLRALQNVPNLLELGIYHDAYYCEKLHFEEGAFPKLKVIQLYSLSRLNSIVIEEGALCDLEDFRIGLCRQLKEVPSRFQNLRKLKVLLFLEMPPHLLMFTNFRSLQTVPNVYFVFDLSGKWEILSLKSVFELQMYIEAHNEVDWKSLPFAEVMMKSFCQKRSGSGSPSTFFFDRKWFAIN